MRKLAVPLIAGLLALTGLYLLKKPSAGSDVAAPATTAAAAPAVRNVIFINGDGMASAHREAGRLFLAGPVGSLAMDRFPYSGQLTTSPADPASVVTDSAAGASAWATGRRTYNGAVSVDTRGKSLPTLGAQAKQAGRATGLVTTAQVTDATPAAFFANAVDRDAQDDIARQYLEVSKPDVILGGGEDWWLPTGTPGVHPDRPAADPTEASLGREGDLVARARADGYQYVSTAAQLAAAGPGKLLGLFANEEMFQQSADVYDPPVDLATMTQKALGALATDPDGFFLLVEEEAVDEFAHANNSRRVLQAMGQLDRAVGVAQSFAAAHPGTLVVVTGDHETGGLAVGDGDTFPVKGTKLHFGMRWTTTGHTAQDVPVSAYGPLADRFTGKHPNTYVHEVLAPVLTG